MVKSKMIRDKKHLQFIRSLPCVVCGIKSQAAHIRRNGDGGTGLKPSDNRTIPLCPSHHHTQHQTGELKFWYPFGGWEAALALAKQLYEFTGERDKALWLIARFK